MRRATTTALAATAIWASAAVAADWTEFRGPGAVSRSGDSIPVQWGERENVSWTVDLPGRGLSGPIVVDGRVVLTASDGSRGDRLLVLAFDEKSGKPLWRRQIWSTGNLSCHPKMCMATPTPASDGRSIAAFFSTNDLVCLDLDGDVRWIRGLTHDHRNASNSVGMSSSPVIAGGAVVVQMENEGDSFVAAVDVECGRTLWRSQRPKKASWASPVAIRKGEREWVLIQSSNSLSLVDPRTGEPSWTLQRPCSTIPTAAVDGDRVYVPGDGVLALQVGETGEPVVLWESKKIRSGTSSPLLHMGRLYLLGGAILVAVDAESGEPVWRTRLEGSFSSTPVVANDKLYAFNEDGMAFVVELGETEGRVVARNRMAPPGAPDDSGGETILCSPALAHGALFVRSDAHLWKIGR